MTAKHTSLSQADIREILAHLDASIAVLDVHHGHMTAAELSLKSMLTALRKELAVQLRSPERG